MRSFCLTIIALSVALLGCKPATRIRLSDVTRPETLALAVPAGMTNVKSLSFVISGRVEGRAHVWSDYFPTQHISGDFYVARKVARSDIGTNFVLHYVPEHVARGGASIRYRFNN